jgi:hypothetical protein
MMPKLEGTWHEINLPIQKCEFSNLMEESIFMPVFKTTMFTCLFKGATSSREEIYYNNYEDKTSHASYSYLY